jgi:hypothetical protein
MGLVLHGRVSPASLDSYEAERRSVGAAAVAQTRARSENLGRENRKLEDRLAGKQMLVKYRDCGWTKDDVSAPHRILLFEQEIERLIVGIGSGR